MSDQEDFSLLDLFREEVRGQTAVLSQGLLTLEEGGATDSRQIEPLMRAAHSIKGAARIVNLDAAVKLAHVMEDAFVAAQHGKIQLTQADIDVLLAGTDLLASLAQVTDATVSQWGSEHAEALQRLDAQCRAMAERQNAPQEAPTPTPVEPPPASVRPEVVIPLEPVAPGEEPLFDLFREEVRSQALLLRAGIERLERGERGDVLEELARAAHSIKGAARIVGIDSAAGLAGSLESVLLDARQGKIALGADGAPVLLQATALFVELIDTNPESAKVWTSQREQILGQIVAQLQGLPLAITSQVVPPPPERMPVGPVAPPEEPTPTVTVTTLSATTDEPAPRSSEGPERDDHSTVVRVTAQSLNRLMSLAGESLVQARWLQPFSMALLKLKKHQDHLAALIDSLAESLRQGRRTELVDSLVEEIRKRAGVCRQVLTERMGEFEDHAGQAEDLNSRLYREVIVSRMRPFSDGSHGFPRLVRDMARKLGKQVKLEIDGLSTEVDRDILERLEAPLTHLIRNATDHGIEMPETRRAVGKSEQGTIKLEVRHRAGMLALTVSDDGIGISVERLRRKVVEKGLTSTEMAAGMTEAELLEFLFLPGFSTAQAVTEYSGRGVGLDVVQDTIRKVGGSVRVSTRPGQGTTFHLQLPITLSVLRAVLVRIAGEPYAFPHNRIDRLIRVSRDQVRSLEHRQFVWLPDARGKGTGRGSGQNVGLVVAAQLLDLPATSEVAEDKDVPVLLLSDETGQYGLIVEAFLGEQDLVVRPLDPRLGKVPNVSAAAILDDGSPVLIADVEDMIRSMDHFIQSGTLRRCELTDRSEKPRKRVLVVDDSITVREVERQLLRNQGYDVAVAVDGKDGWNQLRASRFDLVITDVDMPRMTGLEFVKAIRDHEPYQSLPVIIVSYKDREEDRLRGLELGANYYLTKSSFHDNTLMRAVLDLIGEA